MVNGILAQPNTQLRQLANELVNATFWTPMLKGFRQSQESGLFGSGPGSSTFASMLDREMVTKMSQRGSSDLAESLLRQLGGQGIRAAQANSATESINQGNVNGR